MISDTFKVVHDRHGKRLLKLLSSAMEADTPSQLEALQLLIKEEHEKRIEDRITLLEVLKIPTLGGLSPRQRILATLVFEITDTTLITILTTHVAELLNNRDIVPPQTPVPHEL